MVWASTKAKQVSLHTVYTQHVLLSFVYCSLGRETYEACMCAFRNGYRHVDTAEFYRNEKDVGKAVRDFLAESGLERKDLYITTKLWPNERNEREVLSAFEESYKRLNVDYIDLYLIHSPLDKKLRLKQWKALEAIHDSGRVKSIGISNYGIHHIDELLTSARIPPAVNQIELSPFCTRRELVSYCHSHNIAIEAYSPLTKGRRLTSPAVVSMAAKYHITPAQLLIKWCVQHQFITIPKSVNESRIQENIAALEIPELAAEDMLVMDSWDEEYTTGWDPTTSP